MLLVAVQTISVTLYLHVTVSAFYSQLQAYIYQHTRFHWCDFSHPLQSLTVLICCQLFTYLIFSVQYKFHQNLPNL